MAVCVLPVWIAAGFLVHRNYQSRRAVTEQRMVETARALAMVVDRELANMQAALDVLATSPYLASGDLESFHRRTQMVLRKYPDADIILADGTGQQLVNAFRPFGEPLPKRNVSDTTRQVYATGKPIVTGAFKGAVTGRLVISVDVPVFRDGRVVYDLAMTTPVGRFTAILRQQQLAPEWLGGIFDSNQIIIARSRLEQEFVGREATPRSRQRMRETTEGTVETVNFEGVPVLNGFSRSAISGWTVVIGAPKAVMMAGAWHWLWWAIAGTVLSSITGILLALPIGRSVEQTERASRRLSAIVESSDDAIIGTTLEGVITSWNRGALWLYGYSAAEMIGQPISVLIPPDRPDEGPEILQRITNNDERVEHYETVRRRKDGSLVDVSLTVSPIWDASEGVVGASVIARDISERKRANAEMAEARFQAELATRQLRTIVDTVPGGLHVRDAEGHIILQNDTTRNVYGINGQELPPLSEMSKWVELYELDDRLVPFAEWPMSRILRGEHVRSTELRVQCKASGKEHILSYTGSPVLDSNGKVVMAVMTSEDITERKRYEEQREKLEEQLHQAHKMESVGRLAGGIAHDFNNLLMVIQSYTEILQRSLSAHDPLRRSTQAIMKAADRAAGLTRQLLAYSRKQILSPIVLNLNAVVDETAKMLQRLIGEDIELRVNAAAELWAIEVDSDQIVQVLMNLCVNARDAMPQGGTLTIATGNVIVWEGSIGGRLYVPPGEYVTLSVTDNGAGMSKEIQEHIFEPFFTTKEAGKGTGLGLATVHGIVTQSSGYVRVDSEPGQGACFTIYLPKAGRTITPDTSVKAEERPRGTETLLIAEDEAALREAVSGYLRSLGYTVLEADSGQDALSIASRHGGRIDLLVTDLVMPKISGRELSQLLARLCPDLKTIYMSGYTDDAVVRHGIHEMKAIFLQKPFSLAALACKVRDTLGTNEMTH